MAIKPVGAVAGSRLIFVSNHPEPQELHLIERKGYGHPDTLADALAEELSRAYSRWTQDEFGAILHHNFDKLALLGGLSEVAYGGGQMIDPVRVLVNGRATRRCGQEQVPVDELVTETVRSFFAKRLPDVGDHLQIELNITTNSSPGAVHNGDGSPERVSWFSPSSVEQLREKRQLISNDTSIGSGFAPEAPIERFVKLLTDTLSGPGAFRGERPWCGSDVKVMAVAHDDEANVVLCVPQKSEHVASRAEYLANSEDILAECHRLAAIELPDLKTSFSLNARDIPDRDEIYLTYTGSSIESGDEGVVGRGNRINGMIAPFRPQNLEAVNGKNPVYHVGKVYNVAAQRIAQRIHRRYGCYAEVHLVSATGQPLAKPWQMIVRTSGTAVDETAVRQIADSVLGDFPGLTQEIIHGELRFV
ncbi:S-adenosylmethionine synthetase [Actinokineospora baliensis]|uniref:methionine adenosyltransferase n=1 Tax=Actinokineospora baliensis TaxID=547056 RepID=UPI001958D9F0|nr:methionine adenosyltransferase [Actinokineospora baliensis]MBM7771201.1 S-adenosylmethionine synthetase [Actinokineospora baliensis]